MRDRKDLFHDFGMGPFLLLKFWIGSSFLRKFEIYIYQSTGINLFLFRDSEKISTFWGI